MVEYKSTTPRSRKEALTSRQCGVGPGFPGWTRAARDVLGKPTDMDRTAISSHAVCRRAPHARAQANQSRSIAGGKQPDAHSDHIAMGNLRGCTRLDRHSRDRNFCCPKQCIVWAPVQGQRLLFLHSDATLRAGPQGSVRGAQALRVQAMFSSAAIRYSSGMESSGIDPGRTRTCNPRLRRPMPYPLGHGAC